MKDDFDENLMRRYLLGELAEDEQIEVENRVFDDADARIILETAENDLIDEYAANHLTGDERMRFEKMFLNSSPRREKIEFAEILMQMPNEIPQTAPTIIEEKRQNFWTRLFNLSFAPQFAFAALALLITAFGAWFLFLRQTPTTEIVRENGNQNISNTPTPIVAPSITPAPQISPPTELKTNSNVGNVFQTNKTPTKNADTPSPSPTPTQKMPSAPTFATLIFSAGLTRDNNAPKLNLTISPNTKTARLVFNLEKGDEFPAYQISVLSQTGANIAQTRLTRRHRTVILDVSAAKLPAGFYTATLKGINSAKEPETIGYYDFAVKRP